MSLWLLCRVLGWYDHIVPANHSNGVDLFALNKSVSFAELLNSLLDDCPLWQGVHVRKQGC